VEETPSVTHFWPMDESSGSSFADVIGGANAEALGGVTLGEPGGLVGDSSTAAAFDGSSGAARAEVDLSGTHQLTVEFWMKWKTFAEDDHLAMELTPNFNENPGGFLIDPDASGTEKFGLGIGEGGSRNNAYLTRPSAEQWHYYAFTFDTTASGAEQITPYVDGHAVSYTKGAEGTGAGNFAKAMLYWMSRDASTLFGAGSMQDLALYDTTLSSSTIAEHYELGEGGPKASFTSTPAVAAAGLPVRLDASASSSPAGSVTDYAWDFDGSKSYSTDGGGSETISHTFSSPGTYTVDLRVKDSLGQTATVSHTITVGAALGQYEQAVEETPDVAHFWPMDESSGSAFADVLDGANASLTGGVSLGEAGGLVDDSSTSAAFNGSTGAAHADVDLSGTHELTVEFWMKWTSYAEDDHLALEFTPNFNEHTGGFLVDPDATPGTDFAVSIGESSSRNTVYFERPSVGAWHYYTFVLNTEAPAETEITPYVDGHAVSYTKTESGTGAGAFANSTLYWMSRDASTLFGKGSMQDLALYETALESSAILEHYELGKYLRPTNTAPPTITGTPRQGQELTTSTGTWSSYPEASYAYQWQRCYGAGVSCENIAGTTESKYLLSGGDAGTILRAMVTATNVAGSASASSDMTIPIESLPPSAVDPPEITGTAQEGRELSASHGTWEGSPPLGFAYQWESCDSLGYGCLPILGASSSSYVPGPGEVGDTLRVQVTGSNMASAASSVSSVSAVVTPGPFYASVQLAAESEEDQLEDPGDVAVDASGNVWVLDRGRDRVEEFDAEGRYVSGFGSEGSGDGELNQPEGLALDSHGDVWIADTSNNRVEEFSAAGEYLESFGVHGTKPGQLRSPAGIALDGGYVWVADTGNSRLERYSETGEYEGTVATKGSDSGQVSEPEGLAVDAKGNVWVADWSNTRIDEFNEAGGYVKEIGSEGTPGGGSIYPDGIAVDGGDILVGDVANDRVVEFSEEGEYLAQFGSVGGDTGQFDFDVPMGLAVDSHGDVWVADSGNDRVQEWLASPAAPSSVSPPSVTGEAVAGETLTATAGSWTAGPLAYRYQWQRCNESGSECADIAGADSQGHVLATGEVGATLRVLVSASNAGGTATEVSSVTSKIVAATALSSTAAPAITGAAQDGWVLHVGTGAWSGSPPSSYGYQWESCSESGAECVSIEGATGSEYTLGDEDIGTTLRVTVTATNGAGSAHATSSASTVVTPEPPSEIEGPTISGVPDARQVLHANHGAWTGTERQFSYQWESCNSSGAECAAIEGATGPEYDLGEGEVSTTVRVRIGVGSALGSLTDVSAATPAIAAAGALASIAASVVSGTPQAGQTLTASAGGWANGGAATYAYQWQTCDRFGEHCEAIEGATGASYTLGTANVGATLRVNVTASEGVQARSRLSAATQPVAAAGAPTVERPPLIEGATLQGQTLTATTGRWAGEAPSGYAYQWERCTEAGECTAIEGATASSYILAESDVGSTVSAVVTATAGGGSAVAVSAATARVAPESLLKFSPPSISGVVEVGGELAAEPGIWSGVGSVSYSYQWESCKPGGGECAPIEGANEAGYPLVAGDVSSALRVEVTATNPLGSQSAYSTTTSATPGGEATPEQAEEAAQLADPAVLAASTTATFEGETVAPALNDEEELVSQQALTSSSVSKEDPGELAVNTPDGELSLKPLETSPKATSLPTLVNGTVALFANTWPATDTIDRPEALGASTVLQLRSAEAPRSFSWEAGLDAGQQLRQLPGGAVAVVSADEPFSAPLLNPEPVSRENLPEQPETTAERSERESEEAAPEEELPPETPPSAPRSSTPHAETPAGLLEPQNTETQYEAATSAMTAAEVQTEGTALMVLSPPQAVDADGHTVPTSLTVNDDTVTLTLKPSETTVYPIFTEMPVAAPSDKVSAERDPFEYGLSDLHSKTFSGENPNITENISRLKNPEAPLYIQTARLAIPWDILTSPAESEKRAEAEKWVPAVEKDGLEPYITVEADTHEMNPPSVPKYRYAIKRLIEMFGKEGVTRWGAWNEPDHAVNTVPHVLAAHYWQAAESAAVELGCNCTVVAGEFYEYPDQELPDYPAEYREVLKKYDPQAWKSEHKHAKPNQKAWTRHKIPSTWGFHDYKDVVEARNTDASKFQNFASGHKLGRPGIWISEAGVQLHDGAKDGPPTRLAEPPEIDEDGLQEEAAKAFLTLREAQPAHGISRIERVYYYNYEAPGEMEVTENPNAFDSGLVEAEPEPGGTGKDHGEPRPTYCYLAYKSHRCPPKVVTLGNRSAEVNTYGDGGELSYEWAYQGSVEGGGPIKGPLIGFGVFRPQLITGQFVICLPYRYRAVVKNISGETATGQWVDVNTVCS